MPFMPPRAFVSPKCPCKMRGMITSTAVGRFDVEEDARNERIHQTEFSRFVLCTGAALRLSSVVGVLNRALLISLSAEVLDDSCDGTRGA